MWLALSEDFLITHKDTRMSCAGGRPGGPILIPEGECKLLELQCRSSRGQQGEGSAGDSGFEAGPGGGGKGGEAAPFQSSHSPLAGGLAAEPDSLFALDVLRQRLHEKIQEARGQVGGGDFGVPGAPFAAVVSPLRGGSQRCWPSWAWPAFL